MASYSFKSVGKTQEQINLEVLKSTPIPYGIKTPLQLGTTEGIIAMNYSLEDQFADNLRNLLLTNWGERLGLYDFGANLKPITTELVSQDDFDNEAISRIKSAVERWMPFIDLEDFSSSIDRNENINTAIVKITISYNIPALQAFNKRLQIVLYAI
jgi:phage baseplate assembly protein W